MKKAKEKATVSIFAFLSLVPWKKIFMSVDPWLCSVMVNHSVSLSDPADDKYKLEQLLKSILAIKFVKPFKLK
ncbi:hypothetical protein LNO81_10740 [Klebsiella variicola subsp. variicola]|nr:hypothetical protein [Klebsiella variicola subsp. variicola]